MDVRNRFRWLVAIALAACAAVLLHFIASDERASTHVAQTALPATAAPEPAALEHAPAREPPPPVVRENAGAPTPSGVLRGKVIDAITRQPVREFKVEFFQAPGTIWRRDTPTGRDFHTQDGSFVWERVPAGIWRIIVSASDYQRFEITRLRIDVDTATTELVMPMRKGLLVRGRVFDELTGSGVDAATVAFHEAGKEVFGEFRSVPQAQTNKDGAFLLEGVPPGRITFAVYASGYSPRRVDIAVDGMTPNIEIALSTGASIVGRLVTPDGTPIASGYVGLMDLEQHSASSRRADAQGAFDFRLLTEGRYRLTARAAGMLAEREIVLTHNQSLDLTITLQPGRTVRGAVIGLPPAELRATRVALLPMYEAADVLDGAVDEQGQFELHGAQPGQAMVVASTPHRKLRKTVDVPADADLRVELRAEGGFRLHGRIVKDGKPVPDVEVRLLSRDDEYTFMYGIRTSAEGRYSIDDVPRGEWVLTAAHYRSGPILIVGNMQLDVDIPTGELIGEILDAQGRAPIVGAFASLWSQGSGSKRIRRLDRSNHFGRFTFSSLDRGSYVLTVFRPGFALYRERIEFPAQSTVMVHLSANDGVPIRARDAASGAPLSLLVLNETHEQAGAGTYLELTLDDQGATTIPSGFAGSTLVFLTERHAPITIRAWNGQSLTLAFRQQDAGSSRD